MVLVRSFQAAIGIVKNPTYKQVVKGGTGHYEAVIIHFDPGVVSTKDILNMFLGL